MAAPARIVVSKDRQTLSLEWPDRGRDDFPAEMLRVFSPSAEVQGHHPSERKLVPGKKEVRIETVRPVGNYALRIGFDDGHDTGIYSWNWFRALSAEREQRWKGYLDELEEKGRSRER